MQASWSSEMILLGLLCERPMHGYELAQLVRNDPAMPVIWRFERSEVYFLLGKLRERGYVIESGAAKASGPTRTIYAPTPKGCETLDTWLVTPEVRPRLLRTAFLARVHLALRRDSSLAAQIIAAQQRHLNDWLARERAQANGDTYLRLVLEVRAAQVEGTIKALEDLRLYAISRADDLAHEPANVVPVSASSTAGTR
jgi:DNA-binding PadR family transcriptional regulator